MSERPNYHALSVFLHHDNSMTVRHTWMDPLTRKMISENLTSPPPVDSGPWSWEEALLLSAMELLDRRVAEESVAPW